MGSRGCTRVNRRMWFSYAWNPKLVGRDGTATSLSRFLDRIAAARASLHAGHGPPLEDVDDARGANQTTEQSPAKRGVRSSARRCVVVVRGKNWSG